MNLEPNIQGRTELLLGSEVLERIRETRVIIFGVGGVGSWCAESLVRTGIEHLTIVDSDHIAVTNCNRQLMATPKTVGQVKVDTLRVRLLEINPHSDIVALEKIYNRENAQGFKIETYDYVIDAIDSLKDKIDLIYHVTHLDHPTLFSSMGAALIVDPTKIRVTEFWKVRNDPLGAILRKRMRQRNLLPGKKFLCVYSEELPMDNKGDEYLQNREGYTKKAQINGSLAHITAIFGFTLAGLVIKEIAKL